MYKQKVVIGISGSISAYKAAYLISKLVQNDYEVKVIVSKNALQFIGKATLEGLTGNKVFCEQYEDGEMMSHIGLVKWADIILVYPATANIINKMATGICDDLLTSLFLAHDRKKPFYIAPAMNTNMYEHPATQNSIEILKKQGIIIMPAEEGYLACGETGTGKLIDPEKIYETIMNRYKKSSSLRVLVTSGATREKIDRIRYISNISSGNTAACIAEYLSRRGHKVIFLHSENSRIPESECELITFTDYLSLSKIVDRIVAGESIDVVIHAAAVSDYKVENITVGDRSSDKAFETKIESENEGLVVQFERTQKILNNIKTKALSKNIKLVSFKFTVNHNDIDLQQAIDKQIKDSGSDFVVHTDLNSRTDDRQYNFDIYDTEGKIQCGRTAIELAVMLEKILVYYNK